MALRLTLWWQHMSLHGITQIGGRMEQAFSVQPLAVGPEEAARLTSHSRSAIYGAIAKGELHAFKSGKRRLILVKELEAWINRVAKGCSR